MFLNGIAKMKTFTLLALLPALCCLRADSQSSASSAAVSVSSLPLPTLGQAMIGALAAGAHDDLVIVGTESALYLLRSSGLMSLVAGHPSLPGFRDGHGSRARFNQIRGAAEHSDGMLFICDHGNHRIRRVSPDGAVSTLAGSGQAGYTDGVGARVRFNFPWGIAIDRTTGMMYVSDQHNNRICTMTREGAVFTLCGSRRRTAGFADGHNSEAELNGPAGLAVDMDGFLLVADYGNGMNRAPCVNGDPGGCVLIYSAQTGVPLLFLSSDLFALLFSPSGVPHSLTCMMHSCRHLRPPPPLPFPLPSSFLLSSSFILPPPHPQMQFAESPHREA